jgi:CRP-like cAMP-binding protein
MTYRDLAILASVVREEQTPASGWIAEEGKPTSGLVVLKSGHVRVTLSQNPSAQLDLGPGDFFGELSLVDGDQTRAVGAQAVENCEYLRVHPTDYHQLTVKAPAVAAKLAQGVLESLTEKMELTKQLLRQLVLEKPAN